MCHNQEHGRSERDTPIPNRADLRESSKIRVLLVEDNEVFLRTATEFLQQHHELVAGGAICGGEEALKTCGHK